MNDAQKTIQMLNEGFAGLDGCKAFAVSGSRTSLINDDSSDWDLYIYYDRHITREEREKIILPIAEEARIDASFFEEGDEFAKDGITYDLMYRPVSFVKEQIDRVWVKHIPSLGYSTCFLYNLRTSSFLFDKAGLKEQIAVLDQPYPEALKDSIISYSRRMMSGDGEATWLKQLELAVRRKDFVSRCHRLAALMASYFDMLFANSRVLHPGEKKLIGYAHALCPLLPEDFDADMKNIYSKAYEGDLLSAVNTALEHLYSMTG